MLGQEHADDWNYSLSIMMNRHVNLASIAGIDTSSLVIETSNYNALLFASFRRFVFPVELIINQKMSNRVELKTPTTLISVFLINDKEMRVFDAKYLGGKIVERDDVKYVVEKNLYY